jgi:hypothetical protein
MRCDELHAEISHQLHIVRAAMQTSQSGTADMLDIKIQKLAPRIGIVTVECGRSRILEVLSSWQLSTYVDCYVPGTFGLR